MSRIKNQSGVTVPFVLSIVFGFLFLVSGSLAIWSFLNYRDQKTNVDTKIAAAVSEAKKEQAEKDDEDFRIRENQPYRQFVGPNDYGRVLFDYPKVWSVFEYSVPDDGKGAYQAYLSKYVIPPISNNQQYALRVTIDDESYDSSLRKYESLIKDGMLKSSSFSANGETGTRIDGSFSDHIRGSAVIFKIRDKTLTIRTDSEVFKPEFEELIKTIKFES